MKAVSAPTPPALAAGSFASSLVLRKSLNAMCARAPLRRPKRRPFGPYRSSAQILESLRSRSRAALCCRSLMAAGGSGEVRAELARARASDRVHGAYLFEGPAGTGKTETALWFARLLLCKGAEPGALEACGRCHDCRLFAADAHPDLHRVEPDGARIKVEAIRELRAGLSLVANERGRRVALIAQAEKLRAEAANALLKTLEEPPPGTVLLLVTSAAEVLPRTLRSRTLRVRFPAWSQGAIAAALEAEGMS